MPSELENCNQAGSFLQSGFWGSFKARFGWNARAFQARWRGSDGPTPVLVIRRRLAPGVSFAYVPWGPELPAGFTPADRETALAELGRGLKKYLPQDTAFTRFDPPWYTEGETFPPALGAPFHRAGADVQPPDTVLIDLSGGREAVLAGMKPKWRYNAQLGPKRGVTVCRADEEGLGAFYALLQETAERDGIAIHGRTYYDTLFSHCREYQRESRETAPGRPPLEARLYLAEHEGDTLAAVVALFRGQEAVYLYGASGNLKRNLMAPHALQLKVMEDAVEAGCREYDLFGIPPDENDPGHPMAGLYRFKTGFGGRIIHRPGSWDYAYKGLLSSAFRTAESFRKAVRSLKKKRGGAAPATPAGRLFSHASQTPSHETSG